MEKEGIVLGGAPNWPQAIEERSLNAWPACEHVLYDGWLLRFAHGYTKRANSVVPFFGGRLTPTNKIGRCEATYSQWGLPTVFKVLPWGNPADLDQILARRAYGYVDMTSVQVCHLGASKKPLEGKVRRRGRADRLWLDEYQRLSQIGADLRPQFAGIVRRIVPETCFALLYDEENTDGSKAVSCGRAVYEEGMVGLYGIATDPQARHRGHAGRLIAHLLEWGARRGAHSAYLQVVADNVPALRLYEKLGFSEKYRYWYRVKAA
jgi:N-acetylglutamate synthase